MQILGALISLPETRESQLPLPWWHRAPLGLLHDTEVFIALTKPNKGRIAGDLIVTVLDPNRWNKMYHLECRREDKPGLVSQVCNKIYPLNIALGETVKVEKDGLHHISLICEPLYEDQNIIKEIDRIKKELKKAGFHHIVIKKMQEFPATLKRWKARVKHGWVENISWKSDLKSYCKISAESNIDLSQVVVSADTDARLLRYVFPHYGAMTVKIQHSNEPGAFKEIAKVLSVKCDLNILSSLLRRRGVDAELIAVCEPNKDDAGIVKFFNSCTKEEKEEFMEVQKKTVKDALLKIDQRYRVTPNIDHGENAEKHIYVSHPEEIVARLPKNLSYAVNEQTQKIAKDIRKNRKPIFISRRFFDDNKNYDKNIVKQIHDALKQNGCLPIEAKQTVGRALTTVFTEVSAKMWISKAGIVLVLKDDSGKQKEPLSFNLAHELGFLLGQGKNVLLLIEDDEECWSKLREFSNIGGISCQPFDRTSQSSDITKSVDWIIEKWVEQI